jgi:hypothetical protein
VELNLSATAKTIPASDLGRISPENLGRLISNKASATCIILKLTKLLLQKKKIIIHLRYLLDRKYKKRV